MRRDLMHNIDSDGFVNFRAHLDMTQSSSSKLYWQDYRRWNEINSALNRVDKHRRTRDCINP